MVRRVTHSEQDWDVIGADRQGQLGQGAAERALRYSERHDTEAERRPPAQTAEQKAAGSKQQQHWRPSDGIKQNSTNRLERGNKELRAGRLKSEDK